MRAADSIEKISSRRPEFLHAHKKQLIELLNSSENKESKWHLAQLVSRVKLTGKEKNKVISILQQWLTDKSESRIVRVNSLQALFEISKSRREELGQLERVVAQIYREKIPSLNARIRKLFGN